MDSHFTVRGMIVAQTQSTPLRFKLCRAVDGEGLANGLQFLTPPGKCEKTHEIRGNVHVYIYILYIYIYIIYI
jgi:hypothetical protein